MKKLFYYLSLGLLTLASLNSCKKGGDSIVEEPITPIKRVPFNTEQKQNFVFGAEASVEGMPIVELDEDLALGSMRVTFSGNGYELAPTAHFKASDFGKNKMALHWAVMGNSRSMKGVCDNAVERVSDIANNNRKPFAVLPPRENGKEQMLRLYIPTNGIYVKGELGEDHNAQGQYNHNHYAFMSLGGDESIRIENWGKIYFLDKDLFGPISIDYDTAPNQKVQGLRKGEEGLLRHIPFMTDLSPVDVRCIKQGLIPQKRVKFKAKLKPRGSLIGLRLVNQVKRFIEIDEIILEANNSLNVEGYFDWTNKMNTRNPYNLEEGAEKVPFIATNKNQEHRFPVYQSANKRRYLLPYVSNISPEVKKQLPCFYFWGFQDPSKIGETLKIKIKYHIPNSDPTAKRHNVRTKTFEITAPSKGFQDGVAYRMTIELKAPIIKLPKSASVLGQLATHNMYFKNWYDIMETHGRDNEFTLYSAVDHLDGPLKTQYHQTDRIQKELGYGMPTRLAMARIFPLAKDSTTYALGLISARNRKPNQGNDYYDRHCKRDSWVRFDGIRDKEIHYQTVWYKGGSATSKIIAETKEVNGKYITYALKTIVGHPEELSAWRYSWDQNPDFKPFDNTTFAIGNREGFGVTVKERLIGLNPIDGVAEVSFDDIDKEEFFTEEPDEVVTRFFPANGYANGDDGAIADNKPSNLTLRKTYGIQGWYYVKDFEGILNKRKKDWFNAFCLYFDSSTAVVAKYKSVDKDHTAESGQFAKMSVRPMKKAVMK